MIDYSQWSKNWPKEYSFYRSHYLFREKPKTIESSLIIREKKHFNISPVKAKKSILFLNFKTLNRLKSFFFNKINENCYNDVFFCHQNEKNFFSCCCFQKIWKNGRKIAKYTHTWNWVNKNWCIDFEISEIIIIYHRKKKRKRNKTKRNGDHK